MRNTLNSKGSSNRIFIRLMILGLSILFISGCQQVNDLVNSNKATNTNTTANQVNSVANSTATETNVETNGAVFTKKANVKECAAEPGWKTCLEMTNPSIKIFGSRLASESALNGVANIYIEMTKRFTDKYPKDKFNGYKIYLTNGEPWSELSKLSPIGTMWADQTGKMSGNYLRGGTSMDYLWISEQMICKTGVKTRNDDGTPDNEKRALDQVVHEFAHAIDYRYGLNQIVNDNFNSNPGFPATERFPWAIQNWFGTPAGSLTEKEEAIVKGLLSSRVNFTCQDYKPGTEADKQANTTAPAPKEEVPQTPEVKAFKNKLVGTWENQNGFRTTFTVDKVQFGSGPETLYKILDEKTVEWSQSGSSHKAIMTFEDNGDTLIWKQEEGIFRCKRIK